MDGWTDRGGQENIYIYILLQQFNLFDRWVKREKDQKSVSDKQAEQGCGFGM